MAEIQRIDRIKNLAVFSDFAWDKSLEPFKRYNLLFGWNGSGKTALSRLFASLESGSHEDFSELEFEVTLGGKNFSNQDTVNTKVRVFNSDYIRKNVKVFEGQANLIYVVGEKSQEILNQIQDDERVLNGTPENESDLGKIELRRRANQERDQTGSQQDQAFTDIAKTISAAWSAAGATRNYRRPDAKSRFTKLSEKAILSEDELGRCNLTLSQSVEPELKSISTSDVKFGADTIDLQEACAQLIGRSKTALATQVQKVAIDRLTTNTDISNWVEEGLVLHESYSSTDCEFCRQALPTKRLKELEKHFNDSEKELKNDIDELIQFVEKIRNVIDAVKPHDEAKLYKQFRLSYTEKVTAFDSAKLAINESLDGVEELLNAKRNQTTESAALEIDLNEQSFNEAIVGLNDELNLHNELTANHGAELKTARQTIEDHYLSTIAYDIEVKNLRLSELEKEIDILDNGDLGNDEDVGIVGLQERILGNRAKISSEHKSCEQINEKLQAFFGRDEILFEVKKDTNGKSIGYEIRRGGQPAKHVSEGEKTAIAFAYFCIHLTEQEFSIKDGIVVIDDPISSLDSGHLFRVCAAIKKHMKTAGQLFILTHNFEFFNHIKKWYMYDPQICGHGDEAVPDSRFLMIQNAYDPSVSRRIAFIVNLDPMLRDYESEYHYLFKKLVDFDKDNPEADGVTLQAIYNYPTIARKVLECFLSFRIPKAGSFYVRMLGLKDINKDIDGEEIELAYNFINSHSHLDTKSGLVQFDPTLPVTGPEAIKLTLKLIEQADKAHFKAMSKVVSKTDDIPS